MFFRILFIILFLAVSNVSAVDTDVMSYYKQGTLYYDSHQYEMAICAFDAAIAFSPDFAEAYTNRGIVYYDIGKKEKAVEDLKVGCLKGDRVGCESLRIIG